MGPNTLNIQPQTKKTYLFIKAAKSKNTSWALLNNPPPPQQKFWQSAGVQMWGNTVPRPKDGTMISWKQLLLPINLERVIKPLPNNLESVVEHWETLFASAKHWRQSANLAGSRCPCKPFTVFKEFTVKDSKMVWSFLWSLNYVGSLAKEQLVEFKTD